MARAGTLQARVTRLVDAQASAARSLRGSVSGLLSRGLRSLLVDGGMYDDDRVRAVAERLAAASAQAERRQSAVTSRATRMVLSELGDPVPQVSPDIADLRGGVDPVEVWMRPAKEFRYQVSTGKSENEAMASAIRRAESILDDNLQLADRKASQTVMASSPKTIGYRRVIHPELSQGGTCGLCIAASTRFYYVEELRAIHENCQCTSVPILSGSDVGNDLNTLDLKTLYADNAGSTDGRSLKLTRYQINEHGELGAVLRRKGDQFRDAGDVERDLGKPKPDKPVNLDATTRDEAVAQLQALLRQSPQDAAAIRAKKAEISRLNRVA